MNLEQMTWLEVELYLESRRTIILPVGSTEQHGPMGLIGTDTLCANAVAQKAATIANVIAAPALAYTPAPFNTSFPGTVSISTSIFHDLLVDIFSSFLGQGFSNIYLLNGHGANIKPLQTAMAAVPDGRFQLRSWWEFPKVQDLRKTYYGDWEGMHATPSEVAITQALYRSIPSGIAAEPPEKLSSDFIKAHSGDRHGPPDEHRAQFPDGRVGSHSALAKPEHGHDLLQAAVAGVVEELSTFGIS